LDQIKADSSEESLWRIISRGGEHPELHASTEFTFRKGEEEHKLSVQEEPVEYPSAACKLLLLTEHTVFHNRTKEAQKIQAAQLGAIVHDIRNPIQGILGILDMVGVDALKDKDRSLVAIGKNACRQLIYLTHDITDLAQLENNRLRVKKELFEAGQTVQDCLQLLQFNFEAKGIQLRARQEEAEIWVFSDRDRFTQILLNLLGNALKFTSQGSVTITLALNKQADLLVTQVIDTGIGIREADMARLFVQFSKVESSASLNKRGVGLGLNICRKLSEALGGHITARSRYGEGTTFTFAIKANGGQVHYCFISEASATEEAIEDTNPIVIGNAVSMHSFQRGNRRLPESLPVPVPVPILLTPQAKSSSTFQEKRCPCAQVLVVDDSACCSMVIKAYIGSLHIRCDQATNGLEAVQKVVAMSRNPCCRSYKLVLMDMSMPIMDGPAAALKIKVKVRKQKIPDVPIIALTGTSFDRDEELKLCQECGFTLCKVKPISKEDITQLITTYCLA
jgi:signal transduction histidine kinase